jgi:hypothetical protein
MTPWLLAVCAVELFALVLAVAELRRTVARLQPPSMTGAALEKAARVANLARQEQKQAQSMGRAT